MPKAAKAPRHVYKLKVTLRGVRPSVWRRIEVPSELTLGRLHVVLQAAMGWTDSHLHQFEKVGVFYGQPERGEDMVSESRVRIGDLLSNARDRITYEYDFGDSWLHDIVLEAVVPPKAGVKYPRITAGAQACPPEDVGGPPGYDEFRKAASSPRHPEHEAYIEWFGGPFDPGAFDLKAANDALR